MYEFLVCIFFFLKRERMRKREREMRVGTEEEGERKS